MNTPLAAMFEYNRWANAAVLDACEAVDEDALDATIPGTYGSIRDMLVHVISGQDSYLGHVTGDADRYEFARSLRVGWAGVGALRDAVSRSDAHLIEAALTLETDARVALPHETKASSTPSRRASSCGKRHGIEHRGQICTTLTQCGITPPEPDEWVYATSTGLNGAVP